MKFFPFLFHSARVATILALSAHAPIILCKGFVQKYNSIDKEKLETYNLPLNGCPITLLDNSGGYAQTHPENNNATGNFGKLQSNGKKVFNIEFQCVEKSGMSYCPTKIEIIEEDARTRRLMQEVHYKNIHPKYYGKANASTLTAVPHPRTRILKFCLGDEKRSLVGRAVVGTERRALTDQVLKIVKTIQFTDDQNTQR